MSHGMSFGGVVVSANSHRFTLRTPDGNEEVTLSKWNDVNGQLPPPGAKVQVRVDAKGFCRDWAMAEPVEEPKPAPKPVEQEPPRGALPSRETAITRMAVLNTATAILSSGGRSCEPKDVVKLAGKLEAWVNR